jgi:hypothetical protein
MKMATVSMNKTVGTSRSAMPPVTTVHRAPDGSLHHTRCARRMEFMGGRAGVELDFYCYTCCEHITLNPYVVMRLPQPAGDDLTAAPAR